MICSITGEQDCQDPTGASCWKQRAERAEATIAVLTEALHRLADSPTYFGDAEVYAPDWVRDFARATIDDLPAAVAEHIAQDKAREEELQAAQQQAEALRKYARHTSTPMCPKAWHEFDPRPYDICTCGLAEILVDIRFDVLTAEHIAQDQAREAALVGAENTLDKALDAGISTVWAQRDRDALIERAETTEALAQSRLEVLQAVEWVQTGTAGSNFCPSCGEGAAWGHAADCRLKAALNPAQNEEAK